MSISLSPRRIRRTMSVLAVILALSGTCRAQSDAPRRAVPAASADLFVVTNVWNVHLTFTPDQWEAMEPKGGPQGLFGGPPGGGPGGPGGRGPGGRGGFGPGMFLAPAFFSNGDQNKDGKLTREEFRGLADKWFQDWDKEKSGAVSSDQLRDGLTASLGGPGFGPPRGGGPGGFGRGGSMLQGPEGKRNGLASAMGIEFVQVKANMEFEGKAFNNVAVRYKGNGTFLQSRGSNKRSLKVSLDKFAAGQQLAGVTTLNFHNAVTDASWMNEVLSHRLYRDAGVAGPRTAYARVHVTVPGKYDKQYLGLYSLVEDVDEQFEERAFASKKGAILKPVTPQPFTDLGDNWSAYNQTYDPKGKISDEQKARVIALCKLVSHGSDADFAAKIGDYFDIDQFARYFAVTVWLSTLDSILSVGQNYYVHLDPAGKLRFIPWDLDHSFGQFFLFGSQEVREQLSIQKPWSGENRFLERMFKVEAVKQAYLARFEEMNQTLLRPERFEKQVDEVAAAIRPAIREESESKLERFDKAAAGESVPPAGMGGGGPPGGFPFMGQTKPIKSFTKARAASVTDQLAGKSEGKKLEAFGFGGPPPGEGRGRGPGRPGGPPPGPGSFMGPAFMTQLDSNADQRLTREELSSGFEKWFAKWDSEKTGSLTEDQMRAALNEQFAPPGPR